MKPHTTYMKHQQSSLRGAQVKNKRSSSVVETLLWIVFIINLFLLGIVWVNPIDTQPDSWIRLSTFTVLIWTVVSFFGAAISSFAKKYLDGFKRQSAFFSFLLGFTLSVMLLVLSNHLLLFIGCWGLMGFFMSRLIGIQSQWGEARAAERFTRRYFVLCTVLLSIGLLTLAAQSGAFTIDRLVQKITTIPFYVLLFSALCIITAAVVQSAIYPFHRWLLSAMTAPTPASALMHAGFVNGGGILLALLAPVFFGSGTLSLLLIIGGMTAILAQFTKLLQVNVKQKLACSTIAQMGFMIMQCGLGFFNAAIVHLILHGFYKAYLFLSSGEEVAQGTPQKHPAIRIQPIQALVVLLFGALGAVLFMYWTGKSWAWDSSIFLTLIVAITVGQVTYNMVKQQHLNWKQKLTVPAVLFISGIGLYALFYNGVTVLMADMPMVASPVPLTITQVVFGLVFLIGFFLMKLGLYQRVPWLYVKLLNLSQPGKQSVLHYKS
ncbi:proton-conducting transporter transmembrane domain-containing protein [Croceiramulus getboli]|nr:proton-conducting transporter membrane subunit [Flavobacteriaceae bacterium YJPT1-3]